MKHVRILLDIETQRDLFRRGYLMKDPLPQAANIRQLFGWVRQENIPVVSTVLRVRPYERGPFGPNPHCIEGTDGERKLAGTILTPRINLGLLNTTDLPTHLLKDYQQVVFEKRDTDIFKHVRIERLITELGTATFVLCGAGVAQGIVQAAVGLRSRGFGVVLARDAVLDFDDPLAKMAYLRMEAKGVIFAATEDIIEPRPSGSKVPFRMVAAMHQTG